MGNKNSPSLLILMKPLLNFSLVSHLLRLKDKDLICYLQGINCYVICRNRNNTLDENVKTELRAITMNDLVKAVERALPGSSPTLKTWMHPGVLLQPCYVLLTHLSTRMQDLVEAVGRTTSNAVLHRWPCAEVVLSTAVLVCFFFFNRSESTIL